MMVEGEINNFIMVSILVFISVSYCYAITKIIHIGKLRLVTFFPIICLFIFLPFNLHTIHLGLPTVFFITWLANFKILLLAFGKGPLSHSSLSMFQFGIIACFPVVQKNKHPKNKKPRKNEPTKQNLSILSCAKKALTLRFLLYIASYKDHMPEKVLSFLICFYVIVSLDLLLTSIAIIAQFLLGLELEPPFNHPYLSNSLKEFWGWRWNRVSTTILRATIFDPIVHHAPPAFGLPLILGLLGTFLISGAMHEILHYFLSRGKTNGGGMALFFILHGFLLIIESVLKKRLNNKMRLPQIIIGPIIYGFVIYTFMIFTSPDLMECDVYDRAIQELDDFGAFFRDMVFLMSKGGS